jgi:hypothetical protein
MRWAVVVLLVGCSSDYPSITTPPSFKEAPDSGPQRICGVVPGSACSLPDGEEITRCLCGSFESQIGRLVCCSGGQALVEPCQQASMAIDCKGRLLIPRDDAGAD